MDIIKKFQDQIENFRMVRDWKQFHNPKDLALSLVLESTEVMEHFQWKNKEEIERYITEHKAEIGDELADVFYWVLLICIDLKIDLKEAFERKMRENDRKYPVEKTKGIKKKYNQLD